MERADVLAVMAILKAAYPGYYRGMSRKDADGIVGLWTDMFAEDDPVTVAAAVKALIATDAKGFPPHIGAVKERLRQISHPAPTAPCAARSCLSTTTATFARRVKSVKKRRMKNERVNGT